MRYGIKTVVLHITTVCEHNCPFCYYTSENAQRWHQSFSVLRQIVKNVADADAKEIVFVGGDPATHPDVIELGKYAHKLGLKTTILSNTLCFANAKHSDVLDAFDSIETTIHSRFAEEHDSFCRCEGAYRKVIANLSSYASDKKHLGIVYNLTPSTSFDLFDTAKHIANVEKIPIDHIVLQRIASVGRAKQNKNWDLIETVLHDLFTQMDKIKRKLKIDVILEDTFPRCIVPEKYRDEYIKPCSWGYDSCSIDLNGKVAMCCTDPNYTVGSVLDNSLTDIWNDAPQLIKKRTGLCVPERCRLCADYDKCRGGCILSSITNSCHGDILLPNSSLSIT